MTADTHQYPDIAVIGGSGLYFLQDDTAPLHAVATPYAPNPVNIALEQTDVGSLWFLPRHGRDHDIAPHEINYRANLWALHKLGVRRVIAVNAVGGISPNMNPGVLVLPDQIIDYTWGREHSYFSGKHAFDKHVDFTWPYDGALRRTLADAARACDLSPIEAAVYACTQGPRLESAAEVRRLAQDGCDIVGMTGMPEAALARELELAYASIALVVNKAAGLEDGVISIEAMKAVLDAGIGTIRSLLLALLAKAP